ncbi:S-adenosylmethionine decarboxylase family protein [uncultured Microscilla sp.]|uniref:S-adenosylmethionine decarboxylase family protein n=1 Tax=uncultured Microscilla sp. TaxID=432653 RepID=UPI002601FA4F|nr:S-adenosylmethionine decarboxylase [uncultured Microscilla sp.]
MKAAIYNHRLWVEEVSPQILKESFDHILIESGFTILNFMEHFFQPQGYTAIWLLGESHFALHTFPEENKTYIELSSCNEQMYDLFIKLIKLPVLKES